MANRITRRALMKIGALATGGLLAGCAPKVVEVTKLVEKVVQQTVVQEKVVKETVVVSAATLQGDLIWDTFRGTETQGKWNEERIRTFKEKFPGVKVTFRPIVAGQQEAYGKMYAMFAAGDLGDCVSFDPGLYQFRRAITNKVIMPLDDLMAADKLDLTEWFPIFIEMQKYEGKIWGLPSWGWAGFDCFVVNTLDFEKAGITLPKPDEGGPSMDVIGEWARKFYVKGEHYGLEMYYMDHVLEVMTRSFGGDVLNKEGTKCLLLDNEKSKQGMKWMYDLAVTDKVIPQGEDLKPAGSGALVAGKLSMYTCGSLCTTNTALAVTNKELCNVSQFLYPKQADGRFTNALRCGSWNVRMGSKYPEAAYQFTKHIAGREGSIGFNLFGGNGGLTRPDIFDALEGANPMYAWFKGPLANGMVINEPLNSRGTEYTDVLAQYATKLMDKLNPIPFEQGLKELNDAIQKVLDLPMQ